MYKIRPFRSDKHLTPLSWDLFKKWNSLLTFVVCRLLKRSYCFFWSNHMLLYENLKLSEIIVTLILWQFWTQKAVCKQCGPGVTQCVMYASVKSHTVWNIAVFERIENPQSLYTLWHSHLRWLATPSNFPSFDLKSHRWTSPPKSPETILCGRKS